MGLLIAGVDEAGYGPLLGPLCVGVSVFRIADWAEGQAAPDLWSLLPRSVARAVKGAGDRVVIADSKELKLPNSAVRRHPLTHLERGVLAMLRAMSSASTIASDDELVSALGTCWPGAHCYLGEPLAMPLAWTGSQIAIAANPLREDLEQNGVEPIAMGCRVVGETEFNTLVRHGGGKGATTIAAAKEHFRRVMDLAEALPGDGVRFVCDRLGGRVQYADLVASFAGIDARDVRIVEETEARSRYFAMCRGRQVGVIFQTESERAHLPVALASMTAKLVRELAMARFNRYWSGRIPGIAPTAGYWQDAKRWLKAAGPAVTASERLELVRIA